MRTEDERQWVGGLVDIKNSRDFEVWVRTHLRRYLPHAALLGTFGKLYGIGSVVTHRIGVDFPLNLAESMKDRFGAIDDALACGWFQTGKTRYVDLSRPERDADSMFGWEGILRSHGISSVLVFGVLDHNAKRFALFHICNPKEGGSLEVSQLIGDLATPMALCGWSIFSSRAVASGRRAVGHPTIALTPTELQIVEFLAMGLSNKEIARRRGVSSSTIKTQVSRTGAKLGASRRAEMVAIGMSMLAMLPAQGFISHGGQDE